MRDFMGIMGFPIWDSVDRKDYSPKGFKKKGWPKNLEIGNIFL